MKFLHGLTMLALVILAIIILNSIFLLLMANLREGIPLEMCDLLGAYLLIYIGGRVVGKWQNS